MRQWQRLWWIAGWIVVIGAVVVCAGSPSSGSDKNAPSYAEEAQARAAQVRVTELNQALAMAATGPGGDLSAHDYRLGPGDVIKIEAPQVPEIQGLSFWMLWSGMPEFPVGGGSIAMFTSTSTTRASGSSTRSVWRVICGPIDMPRPRRQRP